MSCGVRRVRCGDYARFVTDVDLGERLGGGHDGQA
jgi:hypothetical protein